MSSQWKAVYCNVFCPLLYHCITFSSALFHPSVSAHPATVTSFFFSAFLSLPAPLPYSHRGLAGVINSPHSLGSSSWLWWRCVCGWDSMHLLMFPDKLQRVWNITRLWKKKKINRKMLILCQTNNRFCLPGLFPCYRSTTCPLNGCLFPIKWHSRGLQLANTPAPAGGTRWRVVTQLPSSIHPPLLLTLHQHRTPGAGKWVGC